MSLTSVFVVVVVFVSVVGFVAIVFKRFDLIRFDSIRFLLLVLAGLVGADHFKQM